MIAKDLGLLRTHFRVDWRGQWSSRSKVITKVIDAWRERIHAILKLIKVVKVNTKTQVAKRVPSYSLPLQSVPGPLVINMIYRLTFYWSARVDLNCGLPFLPFPSQI